LRRRFADPPHSAALSCGAAALLALLGALVSIKIWRHAGLGVPFEYSWDSLYSQAIVKSIIENGSIYSIPELGAPFGTHLNDFSYGDTLTLVMIRAIAIFSGDSAAVMNVFWLATFPLAAAAAWWAMRRLGLSGSSSLVGGVVFSLLPYHFWRGEAHLTLSAYWVVPLGCYLVLRLLRGERVFDRRKPAASWLRSVLTRGNAATAVICVLIACSGIYYAAFTLILLLAATALAVATPGRRGAAASGGVAIGLTAIVLVASLAPALLYRDQHGSNPVVGKRTPVESETLALSFANLVLPPLHHRFPPFTDLRSDYEASTVAVGEDAQALGLLGTAGFLWLLAALAFAALGSATWISPLERAAAVGAATAFLIGTVAGPSTLFAHAVTPSLRAWNRLSVFIAFFALVGLGAVLDRVFAWLRPRPRGRIAAAGLAAALLALALYDQTPLPRPDQFNPEAVADEYHADQRFVGRLEGALPAGGSVFQLPYLQFPEGYPPPGAMTDYDPLRGYLHSEHLRWSYGAMKGRSADIGACLQVVPPQKLVRVVAALGFDALWLDRLGYAPSAADRLEAVAARTSRAAPLRGVGGRYAVFPLRDVRVPAAAVAHIRAALPSSGDEVSDCTRLTSAALR
jgi:phosphoglycerol transferase